MNLIIILSAGAAKADYKLKDVAGSVSSVWFDTGDNRAVLPVIRGEKGSLARTELCDRRAKA